MIQVRIIGLPKWRPRNLAVRKKVKPWFLDSTWWRSGEGRGVVDESAILSVRCFVGREWKEVHDIQPGCVRCYLGAIIPWRLGKKVKSKFICVLHYDIARTDSYLPQQYYNRFCYRSMVISTWWKKSSLWNVRGFCVAYRWVDASKM